VSDVIAITGSGRDLEDVLKEREHELQMMKAKGLVFDTDPSLPAQPKATVPPAKDQDDNQPKGKADDDAADRTVVQAEEFLRNTVNR